MGACGFTTNLHLACSALFRKIPLHLPLCSSMFSSTGGQSKKRKKACGLEPVRIAELQH